MTREHISIKFLAKKIGIDTDEALLILWDAGFNSIADAKEIFFGKKLEKIKAVLSMPGKSEMRSLKFWQERVWLQ